MTIERVRAVIDAATPGPWEHKHGSLYPAEPQPGSEPFAPGAVAVWPILSGENTEADARAIALAHDLMPELLTLWEAVVADDEWLVEAALAALDAKAEEVLG